MVPLDSSSCHLTQIAGQISSRPLVFQFKSTLKLSLALLPVHHTSR